MNPSDLWVISPILVLVGWACILLLVDLFIPTDRKCWTALLAAAGLSPPGRDHLLRPGKPA